MRHELTSADLGVIRKALALVIQYERSELERTYRTVHACPSRAETEQTRLRTLQLESFRQLQIAMAGEVTRTGARKGEKRGAEEANTR